MSWSVAAVGDGKNSILLTPNVRGAVGLFKLFSKCPTPISPPERHVLPRDRQPVVDFAQVSVYCAGFFVASRLSGLAVNIVPSCAQNVMDLSRRVREQICGDLNPGWRTVLAGGHHRSHPGATIRSSLTGFRSQVD